MTQPATVINVDQFLAHPRDRVWRALTNPDQLGMWFMLNDFKPIVGHTFTFTRRPNRTLRFSSTIRCQVLELRVDELLSYSWTDAENPGELDSVVTWTLRAEGRGTRVFLEHRGFDADDSIQQMARAIMDDGWRIYVAERLTGYLDDTGG